MNLRIEAKRGPGRTLVAWSSAAIGWLLLDFGAVQAWAAGSAPATKLVNVADTRAMSPGFSRWLADVYNSNLWLYGLLVVGIMAVMGYLLGTGFDRLVAVLGINLGRLEHHE